MQTQTQTSLTNSQAEETVLRLKNLRIKALKIRIRNLTLQIGLFVLVTGLWQYLTNIGVSDPFFFSSPNGIFMQLKEWIFVGTSGGPLYIHFIVTFEETIISFIVGMITGVIAGYALGMSEILSIIFGPYIKMLNALPRVVLAPIFIIWLGLGMASKVALGVTLVFFIVFFNAFQGVREVDRNLVNNARLLGASRWQLAQHVIIPSALTWILSSLHNAFGFALVGVIVGEFIGSTKGLGFLISEARGSFNTSGVFAGMVVLSVTALAVDWLVGRLEKRFIGWRPAKQ